MKCIKMPSKWYLTVKIFQIGTDIVNTSVLLSDVKLKLNITTKYKLVKQRYSYLRNMDCGETLSLGEYET